MDGRPHFVLRRGVPLIVGALAAGITLYAVGVDLLPASGAADDTRARWVEAAPATSASAPDSRTDTKRTLTVLGAGDVLIHPEVWQQAQRDSTAGGFDFFPMFRPVSETVSDADLALCHMETPLAAPDGPFAGYPAFSAPPQVLQGVKQTGFDGCSTASNHSIDRGEAGVVRTIEAFDAARLGHTGTFRSAAEAKTPKIYAVRGVKVAHLSYALGFNGLNRPQGKQWLANRIEPAAIIAMAKRARAAGAEIVVLSLHWGTEYQHEPNADQRNLARVLLAAPDIDVILGHHAHVVQPIEKIGGKWVVYGMGNQLARHSQPIDENREGIMARVTFTEAAPKRWQVTSIEAIPTWVELTPRIRLVEPARMIADPTTPAAGRATYQAAMDRIREHLFTRGAEKAGLVVTG
ncbi:CapA family protein [Actinoplanes sp. NPDC051494]|uniref:CapA family protein n=1 Tax=Actinoplanes sp. NPDC051494 TaxID=3363907 RepID=UPI003793F303